MTSTTSMTHTEVLCGNGLSANFSHTNRPLDNSCSKIRGNGVKKSSMENPDNSSFNSLPEDKRKRCIWKSERHSYDVALERDVALHRTILHTKNRSSMKTRS
jgi:hypothetical protein